MRIAKNNSGRSRSAFSLIEIMVAVALLAVIIVGLLAMFYHVQRAFRGGTAQVDVMEGGRSVMSILTREVQEATATYLDAVTNFGVVPPFDTPSGASTSLQTLPDPNQPLARNNYLKDLFFLSRQNDEWVGTAYRFDTNARSGVGTLYRLVERQPLTNLALLARIIAVSTPSISSPFYNTNFHRVIDGVVHFSLEAYDTNGALYLPATNGILNAPYILNGNGQKLGYFFNSNALPAFVDIELAVIEPAPLEKFRARADAGLSETPAYATAQRYLQNQAPRTHVFRQRVPIRPATLEGSEGP